MTKRELRFALGADDDLVRLFECLARADPDAAEEALATIRAGLTMAAAFSFSCRKVGRRPALRECVVQCGHSGYVAAFEIAADHILVLAVRHHREDDYH